MDVKAIEAAIPKLSDEELAKLESAIAARRAIGGKLGKTETMTTGLPADVVMVLETLADFMKYNGSDPAPAAMLAKTSNFAAFKVKVPFVMESLKLSALKKNETRAVLRSAISMLYERMTDQGLDTTSRRMMDHIHRLPALLDVHFPGYAKAGLLRLTVRAHAKNANEEQDDG